MDSLIVSPWPKSWPLRVLAAVWTCAQGVVGLLGAGLFRALGWCQLFPRAGAIEVWARGPVATWFVRHGWEGVTVGWCVWYWAPPGIGDLIHERVHLQQQFKWGPLYYPLWAMRTACYGYRRNPFEAQAYAAQKAAGYPNA